MRPQIRKARITNGRMRTRSARAPEIIAAQKPACAARKRNCANGAARAASASVSAGDQKPNSPSRPPLSTLPDNAAPLAHAAIIATAHVSDIFNAAVTALRARDRPDSNIAKPAAAIGRAAAPMSARRVVKMKADVSLAGAMSCAAARPKSAISPAAMNTAINRIAVPGRPNQKRTDASPRPPFVLAPFAAPEKGARRERDQPW